MKDERRQGVEQRGPENLFSEADVMKAFGLTKEALSKLRREEGLPFVKFSSRCRAYFWSDIINWGKLNRTVITPLKTPTKEEASEKRGLN